MYVMWIPDYPDSFMALRNDENNLDPLFSRRITSSPGIHASNSEANNSIHEPNVVVILKHNKTSSLAPPNVAAATVKRTKRSVKDHDGKLTTFLLIMISTLPESFVARKAIRNTWYRELNDSEDVIVRFVVGTKEAPEDTVAKLQMENMAHEDLVIMEDVKDYYITPTNKTLSMMVWAYNNVNFKYFMKMDQITFVHVKNMVSVLKQRPTTKGLYYGRMQFKKRVNRKNSEYKDTTWDLAETYVPFALGGGYILSSDLVGIIARKRHYLAFHPNEDTAVASWIVAYHYERKDDNLWCVTSLDKHKKLVGECEDYIIAQMCYEVSEKDLQYWFTLLLENSKA